MPENKITVALDIRSQPVARDVGEVISETKGFQSRNLNGSGPYDILILEIGEDLEREFDLIRSIQAAGTAKALFLTSSRLEPEVLIQALRIGAKEFFPQPIQREELTRALLRYQEHRLNEVSASEKHRRGKIIHVLGGKGGVGTTTVAVNLSTSLAEANPSRSVALIDMNLLFGEIPIFLDLQSDFDWGEVVKNVGRVDVTFLKSILVRHSSGVFVLPSPIALDGVNVATPGIIEKLLDVMRESFDYIVIDGGQSLDDVSLKILEMCDAVLMVAILSLPCLTNVKRLLWTFQKLGYPRKEGIRVVVNRYHKKSLISLNEAEKSLGQKVFWQIPNDFQTTMSAINQGKILSSVDRASEICRNFRSLASSFADGEEEETGRRAFWRKIL